MLDGLGFDVVPLAATRDPAPGKEARNPPWIRDELILALDLYMRLKGRTFVHDAPEIAECSQLLSRLQERLGTRGSITLRNPNGVYMKLMNFRRFDPDFIQAGKSGLARGNRLEEEVWVTFALDPKRLASVARAIRSQVVGNSDQAPPHHGQAFWDDDDEYEAPEGRLLTSEHRLRERNRALIDRKKAWAKSKFGCLKCEACEFEFATMYGERGAGFIECHHVKPVETLGDGSRTKIGDLALVCANCHRMIDAKRPWISIQDLRVMIDPRR